MKQKMALVLGAGGFIGSHMVKRLKSEGYWVRGVDLKYPDFSDTQADDFLIADLTKRRSIFKSLVKTANGYLSMKFDEVYQFSALMGGAGFIFSGQNDFEIIQNSLQINLNVAEVVSHVMPEALLFFSSSACAYPQQIQEDTINQGLKESDVYPANPDSEYGWEKIISERIYQTANRNNGLNIRIGRFHNIFGPEGTYKGGKEKSPAAIVRKIASAKTGDTIEVWGDGEQTRSFLFIDEAIEGVRRLMQSDFAEPLNIGSDEAVSINDLVKMVCEISGKQHLFIKHIDGPQGVRGRNSDNELCESVLGWKPSASLRSGMEKLYSWIEEQVSKQQTT